MVSMQEIATRLSISRCTVSNILNGKREKYKPETVQRVLETAREMGYISNMIARSLKTGSTGILALVIPDIANPFYIELAKALEHLSFVAGYNLMICATEENLEKENRVLRMLQGRMVDGVIISPISYYGSMKDDYSFPVVCIDRKVRNQRYPAILFDNRQQARQCVKDLLATGARKPLFLAGTQLDYSVIERFEGFKAALKEAGIPLEKNRIAYDVFDNASADKAVDALIEKGVEFDSLFLASYTFVFGALDALQRHNVQINHFAGFDRVSGLNHVLPGAICVEQPIQEMAQQAFDALTGLISGLPVAQ